MQDFFALLYLLLLLTYRLFLIMLYFLISFSFMLAYLFDALCKTCKYRYLYISIGHISTYHLFDITVFYCFASSTEIYSDFSLLLWFSFLLLLFNAHVSIHILNVILTHICHLLPCVLLFLMFRAKIRISVFDVISQYFICMQTFLTQYKNYFF